jgi:hypothetical protein
VFEGVAVSPMSTSAIIALSRLERSRRSSTPRWTSISFACTKARGLGRRLPQAVCLPATHRDRAAAARLRSPRFSAFLAIRGRSIERDAIRLNHPSNVNSPWVLACFNRVGGWCPRCWVGDVPRRRPCLTGLQRLFLESPGSWGAADVCFPYASRVSAGQESVAFPQLVASTSRA